MFSELNILKIFLEDPYREFNVREIARLLNISPATASKHLKYFSEKRILKYQKERIYDLYRADIESEKYRDLKVYYNITKIRDSGLLDEFDRYYLKPTVILFGSGSTGYDTKDSDFDFVIISVKKGIFQKQDIFEKKLGRSLQIFQVLDLKELKNEHLINNVLRGIVLQGEIHWMSTSVREEG